MRILGALRKIYTHSHHWLLPPTCILCADATGRRMDLCLTCEQDLPYVQESCYRCALPLTDMAATLCGACMQAPPFFDNTVALCYYQQPIEKLIIHCKFHQRLLYAKVLSTLMSQMLLKYYIQRPLPELIIPVPLHRQRISERGYNQAVELAREIAKHLKIPMDKHSCQRRRSTAAQSSLQAQQRHANIFQAFAVAADFKAKHVAIIDDVVTTGHTVNELSRMLRLAGVEQIDIWCAARTKLDS